MGKADRKVIHEFANAFNLKSKSSGRGNKRFPILYRTQRSLPYTENAFTILETRSKRRYFPRLNMKGENSATAARRSSRAGLSSAASYRDGDIVGASAPELGIENKGRAMLEKMGWSTGTGLGAANKGILLPITHTIKITKAGLG
jgi:G-patch domain/R3H domain